MAANLVGEECDCRRFCDEAQCALGGSHVRARERRCREEVYHRGGVSPFDVGVAHCAKGIVLVEFEPVEAVWRCGSTDLAGTVANGPRDRCYFLFSAACWALSLVPAIGG